MSQFFDELERRLRDATGEQHAPIAREGRVRLRRRERLRGDRPGRRVARTSLLALLLVCVVGTAVPTTRAAIGDAIAGAGIFARALDAADEHPAPVQAPGVPPVPLTFEEVRDAEGTVAEAEGVRLHVTQKDGLVFVGTSTARFAAGTSATAAGWRELFAGRAVYLLATYPGLSASARGPRRAVAGLASEAVARVELRYRHGPPLTVEQVDGGFVLPADVEREPFEVVARDAAGKQLERAPLPRPLRE